MSRMLSVCCWHILVSFTKVFFLYHIFTFSRCLNFSSGILRFAVSKFAVKPSLLFPPGELWYLYSRKEEEGNPSRLQHSIAGPQQFCDCSHIMASSSQSIHAITWQERCYGTPDAGDEEIRIDQLKTITHHQYLHPVWSEVFFKNPFLSVWSQPLRGQSGLP